MTYEQALWQQIGMKNSLLTGRHLRQNHAQEGSVICHDYLKGMGVEESQSMKRPGNVRSLTFLLFIRNHRKVWRVSSAARRKRVPHRGCGQVGEQFVWQTTHPNSEFSVRLKKVELCYDTKTSPAFGTDHSHRNRNLKEQPCRHWSRETANKGFGLTRLCTAPSIQH